ncbi:MAG: class I ribonucleotide reductase maintenance protein YfaE [Buchnera aphidicola (Meitanaphis microgallis)]
MTYSTIKIYNKNYIIYYKPQKIPLLLILKHNNVYIEHQCQQGFCGVCKVKLLKGNIYYENNISPLAYHTLGDIFPCCCIAKNNIEIKI